MKDDFLANQLIAFADKDAAKREVLAKTGALFEGYHPEMEAVHVENAQALERIVDALGGWPHAGIVGEKGAQAAWIVAQHAISLPAFQKKILEILKSEAAVPRWQAAYLEDRILCFEGKKQIYGTQFDWDEEGLLSPQEIEDPGNVDRRRAEAGLKPLADAIADIRARAKAGNERPPQDMLERRKQAQAWAKKAGWR